MQVLERFRIPIPYTVVIFFLGIGIAGYSKSNLQGAFDESIQEWVRIDADLMLFIFLPPLLFGEAMSLNWNHVNG